MGKLPDYIHEVPIDSYVKEHLIETEENCKWYIDSLMQYGDFAMSVFMLDCYFKELRDTSALERAPYSNEVLGFYETKLRNTKEITENLIKDLHKVVIDGSAKDQVCVGRYRTSPAWIGKPGCLLEDARFVAVSSDEIEEYMQSFVNFYNTEDQQHAFVFGAIAHVLFSNIHPFNDGNGRISRILQEQKMTTLFNKKYKINLLYPLVNLSNNYKLTRGNYYQYQNDILLNQDISIESWNKWFNYVLNMIDDQLYFCGNRLKNKAKLLRHIQTQNGIPNK